MRYIFIGDIHGSYDELTELLSHVLPGPNDIVSSVGDLVRKGPEVAKCLDLWISRRYRAVLGNNEVRALNESPHLDLAHLDWIRSLPLFLDFPEIQTAVVHGGVLPDMRIAIEDMERNRDAVLKLRHVRQQDGKWIALKRDQVRPDDPWWSEVWDGDRTIVYGHSPTPDHRPRIDRKAIGLDTGCVYGGRLTAAIHDGVWSFTSVAARRVYAAWKGSGLKS